MCSIAPDSDLSLPRVSVPAIRFLLQLPLQNEDQDILNMPGVLVQGHGPFTWGKDASDAVHHAVVLEEVAKMAFRTEVLGNRKPVDQYLLDKHYARKHGKDAYYGQDNINE